MALSEENIILHMRLTLREAAVRFRYYAEQHAAKRTPEGDEKAQANTSWAIKCDHAAEIR